MARAPTEIRSLARSHTNMAIKILAGIAKDGTNEAARVSAAVALLDRGWGKPAQAHTGESGQGAIKVVIRHILAGPDGIPRDVPPVIEAQPVPAIAANGEDDDS